MDNSKVNNMIPVEVVYALADEQTLLTVDVPDGSEIKTVIQQSGIIDHHPEIDLETVKVGLFGKVSQMNQTVRARDRIEIYRPLIADPKEVRKRRAAEGKRLKKGGNQTDEKAGKS